MKPDSWQRYCDDSSDEGRFWRKVDLEAGECWTWTGSRNEDEYGLFFYQKRAQGAHRVIWRFLNGPIPEDTQVLHTCDNPPCVRPDHLFLGSNNDNVEDRQMKGRGARGEAASKAKLTDDLVREIRSRSTGAWGEQGVLGRAYGVSSNTIGEIIRRRSWKHVT